MMLEPHQAAALALKEPRGFMSIKRPHWISNRHIELLGGPEGLVAMGVGALTQVRDLAKEINWYKSTASFIAVTLPDYDDETAVQRVVKRALTELGRAACEKVLIILGDEVLEHRTYLNPLKLTGYPVVYSNIHQHSLYGRIKHRWFRQLIPYVLCGDRKGDVLEFGSYAGSSMTSLYYALAPYCPWMRFFAFDSFEGLRDGLENEYAKLDFIYEGGYFPNVETFKHYMGFAGIPEGEVIPIRCDFLQDFRDPEKLYAELGLSTCMIAHVDCDLYLPALAALEFLEPLAVQGTILVFDDYYLFNSSEEMGERRAIKEWLARHPEIEL
jgi:hypothetical protein